MIAREMAILEEMSKLSLTVQMTRAQEPLSPIPSDAFLAHGILHNVPRVCDQPRGQQGRGAVWRSGALQRREARGAF